MALGTKQSLYAGLGAAIFLMGGQALILTSSLEGDERFKLLLVATIPLLVVFWIGLRLIRSLSHRERILRDKASKSEESARNLKWEASHDSLTRLINRREFKNRAEQLCRQAEMAGAHHVMLFLDLDQFKSVNDTCGHHAGDALLKNLPPKLQQCLGEHDTLARIGGDEFGVLLPGATIERGIEIADAISRTVRDFRFFWHGRLFEIGISIGVVPIEYDHCHLQTVFNAADTACYTAKEAGRNQIRVMHSGDAAMQESKRHARCAHDIPQAIRENRLELYVQEIRCVHEKKGQAKHYEMLVRMLSKSGEMLYPSQFIPVAESYGLALEVDRWVVRRALSWMAANPKVVNPGQCRGSSYSGCGFSINLSGQSLSNATFLDEVLQMFGTYGVNPALVTFEVTETAVITNLDTARNFISQLKALGCRFALDDFGSGMSSFGYLQQLDVDYVKIDGSLVSKIANGGLENAMIVAIIHVAQYMDAQTVAEYVEDDLTEKILRGVGIDYLQGYLVHRPMPLEALNISVPANDDEMVQAEMKLVV
ncbi:MAG TPA: EAL domain-containing protein [Gammaproteobacteria bacterium]|nr:EAL domain-containing protein [Gammaproteobacteria bacterium]